MFCSAISRMGCGTSNGLLDICSPPQAQSWVASVTVSFDIEKTATRSSDNKRHDCGRLPGCGQVVACLRRSSAGAKGKLPSSKHIHRYESLQKLDRLTSAVLENI